MTNRWDERYAGERYFYGTEPNTLVAQALAELPVGRGLYLAEGEGRNAVHAAVHQHVVTAVDSSAEGRRKALALARERGVAIRYLLGDVHGDVWEEFAPFDHIVLCFFHPEPELRPAIHARMVEALVPEGNLIVVSFAEAQHGRASGGPPSLELLHDLRVLKGEFPGIAWTRTEELEVELDEGVGHRGAAAVNVLTGYRA